MIREPIECWMNEGSDGQFTSNHQPSDDNCNDIQEFHHEFLHEQRLGMSKGFQEIGLALEKARKKAKRGNMVESVASAYLGFAASSRALYEAMFSLSLSVPFDDAGTPPELRFAFSQLLELFQGQGSKPEVLAELFWASLHGIAELTRTKRFPRSRQKERVRALVERFTFSREEPAPGLKVR